MKTVFLTAVLLALLAFKAEASTNKTKRKPAQQEPKVFEVVKLTGVVRAYDDKWVTLYRNGQKTRHVRAAFPKSKKLEVGDMATAYYSIPRYR